MSISTYAELQTAIASWSNKTNLTAKLPDFITLAEAKINRALRTRWQETTLAATSIDADYHIAIPTDCVAVKALWLEAEPTRRVEQKTLDFVQENIVQGGRPGYYAWDGINWLFSGSADDITGTYFAKVPALATATTNWLLTAHPDLYLYSGLEQAAKYLRDVEGAMAWGAESTRLIDELNSISRADQVSGGPLIAHGRNMTSNWVRSPR